VLTEATGQVHLEVPRDRDGTFEPQIVRKRQRLDGVDEIVLSPLYAKGLKTRGDLGALRAEPRQHHWPGSRSWRVGVGGDHLANHRQGDRGDDRLAEPAFGPRSFPD
jgi:hypothetical protein